MLTCIDSYEISEWIAYERAFGPLGPQWRDQALSAIHMQIAELCRMYAQVNSEDGDVGERVSIPMPYELYETAEPDDDD